MIIVTTSGEHYKLRSGQNRIGRGDDCDLQLKSAGISRHHAMIKWEAGMANIMDLGSTNGTSLNGRALESYEYFPLNAGDSIQLGDSKSTVHLSVEQEEEHPGTEVATAATIVTNVSDILSNARDEQTVTEEMVNKAYEALASGDISRIKEYWDEGVSWMIPGQNPLAGRHEGLDAFIDYMKEVAAFTGNTLTTQPVALMVDGEHSADVSRYIGFRAGYNESNARRPSTKLDVEIVHFLRWRNGKIIEGRSAIFGTGASEYDQFWSSAGTEG